MAGYSSHFVCRPPEASSQAGILPRKCRDSESLSQRRNRHRPCDARRYGPRLRVPAQRHFVSAAIRPSGEGTDENTAHDSHPARAVETSAEMRTLLEQDIAYSLLIGGKRLTLR
jgi:hypothetical protein